MYRKGIPAPKIAAATGLAASTIRYHLHLAAQEEPGLRDQHRTAHSKAPRNNRAGLRNLHDVLAFHQTQGQLPTTGGNTARERALGVWLHHRRQDAAAGTLSPAYQGLNVIPGWNKQPTQSEVNAARWDRRLAELATYRAAGNNWPLHKKAATEQERILGVWLHSQRINHRHGTLNPAKEAELDASLPGWREGRARSGGRRTISPAAGPLGPISPASVGADDNEGNKPQTDVMPLHSSAQVEV
ncbi:helicase associated domain-containing protein [Arthrobacter sp. UYCu723]